VQARPESEQPDEDEDPWAGKTETERRFEKRKQEQLEKRLAKEGIKSHKERVEEYNKYLASLSEHHDMYVQLFLRQMWYNADTDVGLQAEDRTGLTRWDHGGYHGRGSWGGDGNAHIMLGIRSISAPSWIPLYTRGIPR